MNTLMTQGLELMLIGMGVVLVFLIVLVGVTTAMSHLVRRFGAPVDTELAAPPPQADAALPSAAVLTAIEQAIRLHRESSS